MPTFIEKRRQLWYATLKVPEELQAAIGKKKFLKSLGTADRPKALILAMPIVALWKAQLRKAGGESNAVHDEALWWQKALAGAQAEGDTEEDQNPLPLLLTDRVEEIAAQRGEDAATTFAAIARGKATPSSLHFDDWRESIRHLAQKTQDQSEKDVQRLVNQFTTLDAITPAAARQWVKALHDSGDSANSVKRMMSFWRSYWRYLGSIDAVPPNSFPFSAEMIRKAPRAERAEESWVPFSAADVPKLWAAAQAREDAELSDLIQLGAYSGARIEELCALKVERVGDASFHIDDAKTPSGIREVPIHGAIKPLVDRLKKDSKDGYLLSGLTFNKYGDRCNAIGQRFGRLKTSLGYGRKQVFHSLRKTVVTLMEDAGVSENLAADIVGHKKPRITYGLYSGGSSLPTKAAALALVKYPTVTQVHLAA